MTATLRHIIAGMVIFGLALGLGIKIGWDWGRGDFAHKAATVRAVAAMKAADRNKRLAAELDAERAKRAALEQAALERDQAESIAAETAAHARPAHALDQAGLDAINAVIKGVRQ